jgi:tetrahydromethanopterin S-methyltransferase subunit E
MNIDSWQAPVVLVYCIGLFVNLAVQAEFNSTDYVGRIVARMIFWPIYLVVVVIKGVILDIKGK